MLPRLLNVVILQVMRKVRERKGDLDAAICDGRRKREQEVQWLTRKEKRKVYDDKEESKGE